MTEILIAVPVLSRPQRAAPLVAAAHAASAHPVRVLFMCTPGDEEEIEACRATGADVEVVDWSAGRADYARKINKAARLSAEPWILMGADDISFNPNWDAAAFACAAATGALVVGTNDLGNPRVIRGDHATHSLISRAYIEEQGGTMDNSGLVLHEGYDHCFCDDELLATAKQRGVFTFCAASEVPHLHPNWGHGEDDAVYRKGQRRFSADRALHVRRRRLWA